MRSMSTAGSHKNLHFVEILGTTKIPRGQGWAALPGDPILGAGTRTKLSTLLHRWSAFMLTLRFRASITGPTRWLDIDRLCPSERQSITIGQNR